MKEDGQAGRGVGVHSGGGKTAVSVGGRVLPWDQAATVPSAQTALVTFLSQHPLLGADSFITGQ